MIRTTKGLTLIELVIALLISAILVAAVYAFFITQGRTYAVQDNVADMQQNTRVSLITIVRNVRMAGYGVPASCALFPVNSTNGPDRIFVSEAAAIEATPDSEIYYTELQSTANSGATSITVLSTDIDGAGPPNDFKAGNALIISDGTNTQGVVIHPTNYDGISTTIPFATGYALTNTYAASNTRVVPATWYEINVLELRENGDPLALNIEDLQISYQDDNGIWYCTGEAGDQPNPPPNIASIRVVEVNIVARTIVQDAVVEDAAVAVQFNQPESEDHNNPADLNGPDGFRRRVLTTRVHVRNLGGL